MSSSSLARVVIATLGVSVVITLGCSPSGPAPATPFSVRSISPAEGSSAGGTRVVIGGTGFLITGKGGATVTVDGRPVNSSPSFDGNTIDLTMPAHATGKVDVTVIGPFGQSQASVPGGYTYVHVPLPPPVITELHPNIGSTGGGTPMIVKGAGFQFGLTVTIGGIVTPFEYDDWSLNVLYLSTPAHAAGTAEVIVTNPDGQTGNRVFTYAPPATFDFNGDWKGWVENLASWEFAHLWLTIRDNIVVSVLCGERYDGAGAVSLTLDRPPVVANGGFSFAANGGDSITGKIVSPDAASGAINMASCISNGQWRVERK